MQVLELREDEEWGLGRLLHLRRLVRARDHFCFFDMEFRV